MKIIFQGAMMNQLKLIMSLSLFVFSFSVYSTTTVSIKKETSSYILDLKYPQGFKEANINTVIKDFVELTQKSFLQEIADDANMDLDEVGKSGLNITYSIPYEQNNALSVRLNVSVYHRGAAHPLNTVSVLNFVDAKQVDLSGLFVFGADYLKAISTIAQQQITEKNISDAKWIADGTKPESDNYQTWAFTPTGIDIIFDSYQVAAYVYGPQTVAIPLATISKLVKPELLNIVWKH